MLVRFAVENFLSFKEQQVFSMAAGKHTRHKSHLQVINGKRILKGGVIYGANASGKSNLLRAIELGKNIAIRGVKASDINRKYFRVDKDCFKKPGIFQYDFVYNEHMYSYGIVISYEKAIIQSEWLYQMGDKEICIFDRNIDEPIESDLIFSDESNKQRFYIYAEDLKDEDSFLSAIVNKKLFDVDDFDAFFETYAWFLSMIFIFPETQVSMTQYMSNDILMSTAGNLLKYFDTGIESIVGTHKPVDEILDYLPEPLREEIKREVIESFTVEKNGKMPSSAELTIGNNRFAFTMENDELIATKISMNHGNINDLFDFNDESDGTRRLFDLIPLYQKGKEDYVIFVDELDRSFHSKLSIEFIRKFFEKTTGCSSQLIVTLHDSNVMDLELLRQDEIWFVERQEDHSSKVYSLNKFKERYDRVVSKDYLIGRYGAIPCFDSVWIDEEE